MSAVCSLFSEVPDSYQFLNSLLQLLLLNEKTLNEILSLYPKNPVIKSLIEVATNYVASTGGEAKVCTRELRKHLKLYSKNLYPSICDVIRILISCAEDGLGFEYQETTKIYCECSAFYGKTLNSYTVFSLRAEKYLNSEATGTIEKFHRRIPSFIKANFEEPELQCPDKFCLKKTVKCQKLKTNQEPSSLVVEIRWEAKSEVLEILKVLIGIDFKVSLEQIFPRVIQKDLYFKGMILETPDKSRLYCTRLGDLGFVLISDNKVTPIKRGNWQNTVFNLSIYLYRPLLIYYEASEEELQDDMELSDIEYIQFIVLQQAGFMDKWTCFNCENEEDPENEICSKCKEKRVSTIKRWRCECNTSNPAKAKYCKACDKSRFKAIQAKCPTCKQAKVSTPCIHCYSFQCEVPICSVMLKYGQMMYHDICLTKCYGNCFKCPNLGLISRKFICRLCYTAKQTGRVMFNPIESHYFNCAFCLNSFPCTQRKFCFNCDQEIPSKSCPACCPIIKKALICQHCKEKMTESSQQRF